MTDADKTRWKRLVADWESCDLTQREFAQERGITVHGLRYWIYRLRRESRPLVAEPPTESEPVARKESLRLIPVHAVASAPKARAAEADGEQVELALPSGVRLRFAAGTAPEYLRALVAVLSPC